MRRAVRRAAPLAYQHSLIILPITRSAWPGHEGTHQSSPDPPASFIAMGKGREGAEQPLSHLVALPPVGDVRPQLLIAHHLPHLLDGRVGGHQVVVWQLILLVDP